MKASLRTLPFLLALAFAGTSALAQVQIGIQGGYSPDTFNHDGPERGAYLIGGQVRFGLEGLPLIINPSFDYYFNDVENLQTWQFDVDALIPFGHPRRSSFIPYFGAGLGVTRVTVDHPVIGRFIAREQTSYGLNLLGGAVIGQGPIRMFAQARYTMGKHAAFVDADRKSGPGVAFTGGLLFRVGR